MTTIINILLALGALSLIFGAGLGFASIKFKVEEDPKLGRLREALPGANCGGCGYAGCDAFANAVLNGVAKANGCPVGGEEVTKKVADILGIKIEIKERMTAFIRCGGCESKSTFRYDYIGLNDCVAASQLAAGGAKTCKSGCLGGGSCLIACKFDAIKMVDGIAKVDKDKCISCTICVSSCPRNLIELVPHRGNVFVNCNSHETGKVIRTYCTTGCIACKMCEKVCEYGAITVTDNLARIDQEKCVSCGACVLKCPTNAIISE